MAAVAFALARQWACLGIGWPDYIAYATKGFKVIRAQIRAMGVDAVSDPCIVYMVYHFGRLEAQQECSPSPVAAGRRSQLLTG